MDVTVVAAGTPIAVGATGSIGPVGTLRPIGSVGTPFATAARTIARTTRQGDRTVAIPRTTRKRDGAITTRAIAAGAITRPGDVTRTTR